METRVRWLLGSAALVAVGAWIAGQLPWRVERTQTDSRVAAAPEPAPATSPPLILELPPRNDATPLHPAPLPPARQLYIPRPAHGGEVVALAARAEIEGEHGTESENAKRIAEEFRALGPGAVDFLAEWLFTDGRKRSGMDGAWLLSTITTPKDGDVIARLLEEGPSPRRSLALRWLSRRPQQGWSGRPGAAAITSGLAACVLDSDKETRELAVFHLGDAQPRDIRSVAPRLLPVVALERFDPRDPTMRQIRDFLPWQPENIVEAVERLERCGPAELDQWQRLVMTLLPTRRWKVEDVEPVIGRIMRGTDRDKQRTLLLAFTFKSADVRAIRPHAERILREGKPRHDEGFLAIARAAIER